ncbi:MAG TPA: hypothetical protein ENH60_05920 [Pricia sp.]|nr:hypothetical protein [Pricia sp.]
MEKDLAYWKSELVLTREILRKRRMDLRRGHTTNVVIVDCNEAMFEAEDMVAIIEKNILFSI